MDGNRRRLTQGAAMLFRLRELLIWQRAQAINALCSHPPGQVSKARHISKPEGDAVVYTP
ncbi:MAG: hypothetical protein ACJA0Y_002053 [Maricaulis maris]